MRTVEQSTPKWRLYRLRRSRLVCWARGHPQEVGHAALDERGMGMRYRLAPEYSCPANLVRTACSCGRKRVEVK